MSEQKQRGLLSHQDIDDVAEAIRAARMIAEVVSRTVCEEMQRLPDGGWSLSATGGDLLDYFTGLQGEVLDTLKAKYETAVGPAGA